MLQRDYFFEFAGVPQAGKTTIVEIIAHFLKRKEIPIEEFYGGSRYSPLINSPRGDLNLWLACKTAEFVIEATKQESTSHKIFLLDTGLVDRLFFTETLLRRGEIEELEAVKVSALLTLPRLLEKLDGVFIFVVSPELALQRENANKLFHADGEVMNANFLSTMYSVATEGYQKAQSLVRNVHLIDTEQEDQQVLETARFVADNIWSLITENQLAHNSVLGTHLNSSTHSKGKR